MRGRQPTVISDRPADKSPSKERLSQTLVQEAPTKRKGAGRKDDGPVYRGAKKTAQRRSASPDSGAWPVSSR